MPLDRKYSAPVAAQMRQMLEEMNNAFQERKKQMDYIEETLRKKEAVINANMAALKADKEKFEAYKEQITQEAEKRTMEAELLKERVTMSKKDLEESQKAAEARLAAVEERAAFVKEMEESTFSVPIDSGESGKKIQELEQAAKEKEEMNAALRQELDGYMKDASRLRGTVEMLQEEKGRLNRELQRLSDAAASVEAKCRAYAAKAQELQAAADKEKEGTDAIVSLLKEEGFDTTVADGDIAARTDQVVGLINTKKRVARFEKTVKRVNRRVWNVIDQMNDTSDSVYSAGKKSVISKTYISSAESVKAALGELESFH